MSGALRLLPLYAFTAWTGTALTSEKWSLATYRWVNQRYENRPTVELRRINAYCMIANKDRVLDTEL